jgi:integrase
MMRFSCLTASQIDSKITYLRINLMPTIKLTKSTISRLHAPDPSGKQRLYWDTELKGFGVLVSGTTNGRTYVAQRTLPGGKVRRITIGSVAELDLDQARAEAANQIHAMRLGTDPKAAKKSPANWTLAQALTEYVKARNDLRAVTAKYYRYLIERYLNAWLDRSIASITPDMVEARHQQIQAEIAASRGALPEHFASAATGSGSANIVMVVFGTLWNFVAEREPAIGVNPVKRLKRQWYPVGRRERVILPDQLPAFYSAVDKLEHWTMRHFILLLLFNGLRKQEAAALSWSEIDFINRVIRVPARRTKNKQKLDLPMSSFVSDLLVARRSLGRDSNGFVFASQAVSGHLEDPVNTFKMIAKATGISVSCHDLRRTFITIAESTEISILALKALVNHTLGSDVTSGYVQMSIERLREPAQRVCDRIMQLCQITAPGGERVARLR